MSTDKNEKVKPKEIFLNRNKELSKACSGEPGSRAAALKIGIREQSAVIRYSNLKNYGRNQIDGNLRMTVKSHAFSIGHLNVGDRHIVAATKKQDCEDYTSREHVANF